MLMSPLPPPLSATFAIARDSGFALLNFFLTLIGWPGSEAKAASKASRSAGERVRKDSGDCGKLVRLVGTNC